MHSTTMCSWLLQETMKHYQTEGSNVYCSLLDSTKAFDRVNFAKLFKILREKGLPAGIVRFLYNMYISQKARIRWDGEYSESFNVSNGVRQGAVLSPIFYTLYIDGLLRTLASARVGCHIGHTYVGSLAYADDLTLVSPSVRGLKTMLRICEKYAAQFDIKFNGSKSEAIAFTKDKKFLPPRIYLDGENIPWVKRIKHLGHWFHCHTGILEDLPRKRNDFIKRVNVTLGRFGDISSDVQKQLFLTKCSVFYGSELWPLECGALDSIYTTWNVAARRVYRLHPWCHRKFLSNCLTVLI